MNKNLTLAKITFPIPEKAKETESTASDFAEKTLMMLLDYGVYYFDYADDEMKNSAEAQCDDCTLLFPVYNEEDVDKIKKAFSSLFESFEYETIEGYEKYIFTFADFIEGMAFYTLEKENCYDSIEEAGKRIFDACKKSGYDSDVGIYKFIAFDAESEDDDYLFLEKESFFNDEKLYNVLLQGFIFKGFYEEELFTY